MKTSPVVRLLKSALFAGIFFGVTPVTESSASFVSTQQKITIIAAGDFYQELIYNFATTATSLSPVVSFDADVLYPLPTEQTIGIFNYDFSAAAFTEAVYVVEDVL